MNNPGCKAHGEFDIDCIDCEDAMRRARGESGYAPKPKYRVEILGLPDGPARVGQGDLIWLPPGTYSFVMRIEDEPEN